MSRQTTATALAGSPIKPKSSDSLGALLLRSEVREHAMVRQLSADISRVDEPFERGTEAWRFERLTENDARQKESRPACKAW